MIHPLWNDLPEGEKNPQSLYSVTMTVISFILWNGHIVTL